MIRREDLGRECAPASNRPAVIVADLAARDVRRGQAVRIVGLGTLARIECRFCTAEGPGNTPCPASVYRFTLTAKLAAAYRVPFRSAIEACPKTTREIEADVRHLARALGAPVEVYGPGQRGQYTGAHPHLITTVHP